MIRILKGIKTGVIVKSLIWCSSTSEEIWHKVEPFSSWAAGRLFYMQYFVFYSLVLMLCKIRYWSLPLGVTILLHIHHYWLWQPGIMWFLNNNQLTLGFQPEKVNLLLRMHQPSLSSDTGLLNILQWCSHDNTHTNSLAELLELPPFPSLLPDTWPEMTILKSKC